MRTNHELIKETLKHINKMWTGMCGLIKYSFDIDMTEDEREKLMRYIASNLPEGQYMGNYWWKEGDIHPRREWLEHNLILTSPKKRV